MTYNKVVSFFRNRFLSRYDVDPITGQQISIMDLIYNLEHKIEKMQQEIDFLKEENIENSNLIYELMNSIESVDSRIDIITAEKFIQETNV